MVVDALQPILGRNYGLVANGRGPSRFDDYYANVLVRRSDEHDGADYGGVAVLKRGFSPTIGRRSRTATPKP